GQDRDKKWHFGDLHHYWDGSVGIREIENKYGFVVQPDTVGQFTGLYDIDGKEIFEGDIVNDTGELHEIYYNSDFAMFLLDNNDGVDTDCKVVGNIHDNYDLLKEGKIDD
ncbi:MAG: hypothetical protein IJ563_11385, partial [Selenomonadaceae bacterium]|nr:hypothetical protein [Selenomonadaceae bacterium]